MARNYDAWDHWWMQWSWEAAAQKFESTMGALQKKCDWLRRVSDSQAEQMKRLDEEVARLGRESNELRQRVLEVEGVNASQLDRITELTRELEEVRSGVAGASAAGVSEIPAEAPVVGEPPWAARLASTSDEEKQWEHPEARDGETASSRGGRGPCQNCRGGTVLDRKQEEKLKEKYGEWPQMMWPWCSHLGSTLFSKRGMGTWSEIEKKLTEDEGRFLVWGSTNKNSRFYICRCECKAMVTAQYAVNDGEKEHQDARDTLARFVLGRKAQDSLRS